MSGGFRDFPDHEGSVLPWQVSYSLAPLEPDSNRRLYRMPAILS